MRGKYGIQHSWYIDDFGFNRNSLCVIHKNEDGSLNYYPIFCIVRVHNINDKEPYMNGDNVLPFTDEEYEEMLDKEVSKIQ